MPRISYKAKLNTGFSCTSKPNKISSCFKDVEPHYIYYNLQVGKNTKGDITNEKCWPTW